MSSLARRYAAFVDRRRHWIFAASLLLTGVSLWLCLRLPILTDTTVLLPPSARSVQDLRAIEARARATGTLLVVLRAPDPATRAAAAKELRARLETLRPGLLSDIVEDDLGARSWGWQNRFLFATLEDLRAARDALARRIEEAKLEANPAYVSFEDEDEGGGRDPKLEELEKKWKEAEEKAAEPPGLLSKDGKSQLFMLRTPISSAEVGLGAKLDGAVAGFAREVEKRHGVEIGITGDIHTGVVEQQAILGGMQFATVITISLVTVALLLYFRSLTAVLALLFALAAGVLGTFGATRLLVGHLNSVSAFLAAIVVGVGIDFGIVFLARWFEERRAGRRGVDALAGAIAGSAPGTFTAACAVGVAYGSLMATQFRGFREFGVIGGMGMALCWLAAYTTLPALVAMVDRAGRGRGASEPRIGPFLGRLMPRHRLTKVAWVGLAITVAAALLSWRYLAGRPFERDWGNLRSTSRAAAEAKGWYTVANQEFGRGLSGAIVIAAPTRDAARETTAIMRRFDAAIPEERRYFGRILSLDDLIPTDQPAKLAVIAELRQLLDDDALEALDEEERERIMRFRPPDDIKAVGDADVPPRLADAFVEKDGHLGRIMYVNFGKGVKGYDADSLADFVDVVRGLQLPDGVHVGGAAFVFTDITRAVERDGVRATIIAIIGVALFVLLLVGFGAHALVTLACVVSGTAVMIAVVSLLGIKINFLDFAALPLTLGISVEYSVNIVLRHRVDLGAGRAFDPVNGTLRALTTTGGAVALCSFTTTVGYGSLGLSDNAGIRSFGIAATIGELACLASALTLGPALLWVLDRRRLERQPKQA